MPPKARRRESGSRQPQHGGQLCPAIWQQRQPSAGAGYVGSRTGQLRPGARHVLRPSVASASLANPGTSESGEGWKSEAMEMP